MSAKPRAFSVEPYWLDVSRRDREALRECLYWDMVSEYDARFLTDYLRTLDISFSDEFRASERQWARDEQRHFEGFAAVYDQLFGMPPDLDTRRADFGPVAHLFGSEFEICCLMAYDELSTIRGFRVNLHLYDRLGPAFGAFVREVIADEGRHYGAFSSVLRKVHAHRLQEAPEVVARVRATEGTPYTNTFVLDHEESLYTDEIFDDAARVLLRALENAARQHECASG